VNINTMFTRELLKSYRQVAKVKGIKIPKFSVWVNRRGYFEVRVEEDGVVNWPIIWAGRASNKYEAKSNAVARLIKKFDKKNTFKKYEV